MGESVNRENTSQIPNRLPRPGGGGILSPILGTHPGEAGVKDLVREGVQNLETSLGEIVPALLRVSSDYRLGRDASANSGFGQCLEALRSVIELVAKFREVSASGAFPDFPAALTFAGHDQRLLGLLNEMSSAQQGRDWIFLADLIEYELVPILKEMAGGLPDALRALA